MEEEGRKITDVAYELEIPYSTLSKWVSAHRRNKKVSVTEEKYVTPSELKKIENNYEKKMRELEEENEILKKAMRIFTKNPE
ncbi:transposase [Peribacillus sp. B-H-3]|uniref:transposase n=1 Tax=Peribacillus sp. B-H-3 TaxID=3400420 RepID=UPI003B013EAF